MTDPNVRDLTQDEIDRFIGDSSTNVAIISDGVEYYGDAYADYPDGEPVVQFIVGEDGYYVEVC